MVFSVAFAKLHERFPEIYEGKSVRLEYQNSLASERVVHKGSLIENDFTIFEFLYMENFVLESHGQIVL